MMTTKRSYRELSRLKTFKDRYDYLKLDGVVGESLFGSSRWVNQEFYRSKEWANIRKKVIVRDSGCEFGLEDYPINGKIIIHHMNPLTLEDIVDRTEILMDPEYLICVSKITHDAIHYGDWDLIPKDPIERRPNDTCPWKI